MSPNKTGVPPAKGKRVIGNGELRASEHDESTALHFPMNKTASRSRCAVNIMRPTGNGVPLTPKRSARACARARSRGKRASRTNDWTRTRDDEITCDRAGMNQSPCSGVQQDPNGTLEELTTSTDDDDDYHDAGHARSRIKKTVREPRK